MKQNRIVALSLLFFVVIGCQKKVSLAQIQPKVSADTFQMLVEIPSGTHAKIEYNKKRQNFEVDQKNGEERHINYLGYPANYGFIPHTVQSKKEGGDGDALDVMLLSKKLKTGTTVQFKPIGYLKLRDQGELDIKIIGIPKDKQLSIISAENFHAFSTDYRSLRRILQLWFENYADDAIEILGWYDENATIDLINDSINEEKAR
ncbi:MAG: inorganic diphosphatase [Flavobacteriaceae bacterium]|nr:inorganic diphosphatase [Psychroflexus sp.]